MTRTCQFVAKSGERCCEPALDTGYCFWHDPHIDKSDMDLTEKLEDYTHNGGLTKGLKLKRANLQGINLVNAGQQNGYDFSESDFYRANLRDAHLFNLTLRDGSLMKANLCEANLHCADLTNTNLLGIKLHEAKLDNLHIGDKLQQERLGKAHFKQGDLQAAQDNYEQSEEIYRQLRKVAEDQGLFNLSGQYAYRERVVRRNLMKRCSVKWFFSKLMDLLCGYGEKPENTITFSVILIIICALGYFIFGVNYYEDVLKFVPDASLTENLTTFAMALYYSVVTFTTLGYGDVTPFGITRFIAVLEAFLGSFTIALFVVVFVRRMSR